MSTHSKIYFSISAWLSSLNASSFSRIRFDFCLSLHGKPEFRYHPLFCLGKWNYVIVSHNRRTWDQKSSENGNVSKETDKKIQRLAMWVYDWYWWFWLIYATPVFKIRWVSSTVGWIKTTINRLQININQMRSSVIIIFLHYDIFGAWRMTIAKSSPCSKDHSIMFWLDYYLHKLSFLWMG